MAQICSPESIEQLRTQLGLPIFEVLDELQTGLAQSDTAVLEAPPGAGKTTMVPLALIDQPWLMSKKILLLEPRRLAARAAAERMASLLGEQAGQTIGYRVRQDSKVGPQTRVEVITEGVFSRMLQSDPSLEAVGLVIFDEFHERHLDADLGLALSLEGRDLFRDADQPLKILIMSATLDGEELISKLSSAGQRPSLIRSQGRQYPVDIVYSQQHQKQLYGQNKRAMVDQVVAKVLAVFKLQAANILVFLPGQAEIKRCQAKLEQILQNETGLSESHSKISIEPLYGELKLEQQRRAIAPCVVGQYKIVLATSIAESSLTIDGVNVVIDAGLARQPVFDPNTAMTRLATVRVSKAAGAQRAGRAGRLQAGRCYRLWSESEQQSLAEFSSPEIEQADLADLLLALASWGVAQPLTLNWISPPPPGPLQQARQLLLDLKALQPTEALTVTAHGQAMARVVAHPRIAHMLIMAKQLGQYSLACDIAALLMERDFLDRRSQGVDFELRLQALGQGGGGARALLQRVKQSRRAYQQLKFDGLGGELNVSLNDQPQALALLLALAYPERVARRKNSDALYSNYQLANGRQATLDAADPLCRAEFIVIAQLGGREGSSRDQIFLACEIGLPLLLQQSLLPLETRMRSYWDKGGGAFRVETETRLGRLLLATQPERNISPELRQQALLGYIKEQGLQCLNFNDKNQQLIARLRLVEEVLKPDSWPGFSEQVLLLELEDWLAPHLHEVTKLGQLNSIDLAEACLNRLSWQQQQQLKEWAPSHIKVASGSNIGLDYCQQPPVLAVKLQEMFGCGETPKILQGQVAIMVHLLSPARRPLQITQDLAGFWRGSYQQVKKEMKGRYPRHPWPEDPTNAVASRKIKPRK